MICAARQISISGIMLRKSYGRSRQRFKSRVATFQGGGMAPTLTPEDVVRRIASECAYIDERGGVGIRLEPAAAIVRQYGEQFRRPQGRKQTLRSPRPVPML